MTPSGEQNFPSPIIVIATLAANDPIGPVRPSKVASSWVKLTLPKLARGPKQLPLDGSSTTHSAVDRGAPSAASLLLNSLVVPSICLSLIVTVNNPLLISKDTSAEI